MRGILILLKRIFGLYIRKKTCSALTCVLLTYPFNYLTPQLRGVVEWRITMPVGPVHYLTSELREVVERRFARPVGPVYYLIPELRGVVERRIAQPIVPGSLPDSRAAWRSGAAYCPACRTSS